MVRATSKLHLTGNPAKPRSPCNRKNKSEIRKSIGTYLFAFRTCRTRTLGLLRLLCGSSLTHGILSESRTMNGTESLLGRKTALEQQCCYVVTIPNYNVEPTKRSLQLNQNVVFHDYYFVIFSLSLSLRSTAINCLTSSLECNVFDENEYKTSSQHLT